MITTTVNTAALAQLAEKIAVRLTIEIEASGRHVHLSRPHLEALFGLGYQLNRIKDLSQPGQFVCAERVTLAGPKGEIPNVVILGPERPESQVEISLTDAVALGVTPPVRLSGQLEGTPGITIRHGDRSITLSHGLIAAKRHIHMTPEDAALFGVTDRQRVRLKCYTSRPLILEDVELRVSSKSSTVVHLDYDEANACGFRKGDRGLLLL
ncbi:MAG: phosphate propanoyltransferase [Oscillospiraceae bacterium]|nr:phosphate propanoyltransferase [Oscillospiraceae bacterium]